ncbi:MAG: hypothetical protein V1244_03265, partial [Nitrospinaceae bacterium]|nr:hypothetical protein [Nitrospinaceae bacterium]
PGFRSASYEAVMVLRTPALAGGIYPDKLFLLTGNKDSDTVGGDKCERIPAAPNRKEQPSIISNRGGTTPLAGISLGILRPAGYYSRKN